MLQEIAHTVTPDARNRNDLMDILAYVHIKRLRVATDRPQAQVSRALFSRTYVERVKFQCFALFERGLTNTSS